MAQQLRDDVGGHILLEEIRAACPMHAVAFHLSIELDLVCHSLHESHQWIRSPSLHGHSTRHELGLGLRCQENLDTRLEIVSCPF